LVHHGLKLVVLAGCRCHLLVLAVVVVFVFQSHLQEREDDNDIQPKRPTSNRDEPTQRDTGVTQSDWDKFA
jgi:hypothetical protein